ncbi:glutamyl-tRNA(Gln) amidotransferase subunit A [Arthrobacter sp. Hiyo8]|nr:glutamyl-tRNA(Gln) amidotransferase subunit A [Arthrobacter sp. Hiyo8]
MSSPSDKGPAVEKSLGAERYAGGSSIGSGVAVAVGSAPGALGTDTSGSVRNPASVNGLVGLKATAGLVDGSGVLNVSHTLDHIGPITRSVSDCAVLLQGMLEPATAARLQEMVLPEAMPARPGWRWIVALGPSGRSRRKWLRSSSRL